MMQNHNSPPSQNLTDAPQSPAAEHQSHGEHLAIFDTTLRDGEQSPGFSMNLEEKLQMAHQLAQLGVNVIEAGFPIASEEDLAAVTRIAKEVRDPIIAGLCRAADGDIEACARAVESAAKPRIHTFVATSDIHLRHKLKRSRGEVIDMAIAAVSKARSYVDDVEFSAEDAGRSDIDYLCEVITAAIGAGATVINLPDTVGYRLPAEYAAMFRAVQERVPDIDKVTLSAHCHNDLGLAVANSLAAVQSGVRQVECTVNGIGERAGNAALEEVVMALYVRRAEFGLTTTINTEEIFRSSELLSNTTGMPVQANKAIVGKNAFAHEAGIHQDGVLKAALTYEIMTPQVVGIPERNLVLGKHSGRHALDHRYRALGYVLEPEQLERAYILFTRLADKKKTVYDEDLLAILRDETKLVPETYRLRHFHISGGPDAATTVALSLEHEGAESSGLAVGDGPIDATVTAVDYITKYPGRVLDYTAKAVTRGREAVGEVFIRAEFEGKTFVGKAASTDLNIAGARSYVDALNKALWERARFAQEQACQQANG